MSTTISNDVQSCPDDHDETEVGDAVLATDEDDLEEYEEEWGEEYEEEWDGLDAVWRLTRILYGEDVVVTSIDWDALERDYDRLKSDLQNDLEDLDADLRDELYRLAIDDDSHGEVAYDHNPPVHSGNNSSRSVSVRERYEHLKTLRENAFGSLRCLPLGIVYRKNDEITCEILRLYGSYVTFESGPKAVRRLFQWEGTNIDEAVIDNGALLDQQRKAIASAKSVSEREELAREIERLEALCGLLRKVLDMEEAERRGTNQ